LPTYALRSVSEAGLFYYNQVLHSPNNLLHNRASVDTVHYSTYCSFEDSSYEALAKQNNFTLSYAFLLP
jgi:hypothetical protein